MKELKYKIGFLLILLGLFNPTSMFAASPADSSLILDTIQKFWANTSFANFEMKYLVMIIIGVVFIYLGIAKKWEPLLLIPIGFGILVIIL